MKQKKQVKKLILEIADKLPQVFDTVLENEEMLGSELKLTPIQTEDGSQLEDDKKYLIKVPTYIASNHARRMWRAYKQRGAQGIGDYVARVNKLALSQQSAQS